MLRWVLIMIPLPFAEWSRTLLLESWTGGVRFAPDNTTYRVSNRLLMARPGPETAKTKKESRQEKREEEKESPALRRSSCDVKSISRPRWPHARLESRSSPPTLHPIFTFDSPFPPSFIHRAGHDRFLL